MSEHIKPLTTLRGVAALLVMLFHFLVFLTPQFGNAVLTKTHFFHNGYLWVDFFFILSGFVLAHVYAKQFLKGVSSHTYKAFLFSRFARIYPLHIFMLLPFLGIELIKLFSPGVQAFSHNKSLLGLFTNIFLLQAIDLTSPPLFEELTYWNEPAWSVSAEWFAYTVLPFFLFIAFQRRGAFDLLVYILGLLSLFMLVESTSGHLDFIGLPSLIRCIVECSLGVITYKIHQREIFLKNFRSDFAIFFSGFWIVFIMHYDLHDVLIVPAFCLLILAASAKNNLTQTWVAATLNSALMIYLGEISYSTYMVHWFIQDFVLQSWQRLFNINFEAGFNIFQSLIALILVGAFVLFTASLAYKLIELPMRDYLKSTTFAKKFIYCKQAY